MRVGYLIVLAALAVAPPAWAQVSPEPPSIKDAPASAAPIEAPSSLPPASTGAAATPEPAGRRATLSDYLQTHVEQVRRGNRVSEVRVTGAGGELRYTMENREGRTPLSTLNSGSGLSTPNFIRIDF